MHRDSLLVDLVIATNAGGARVPVTLLIGGALLSGQIASTQDYADAHPTMAVQRAIDDPHFGHLADATVNGQAFGWWRFQIARVDAFSLPVSLAEAPVPSP